MLYHGGKLQTLVFGSPLWQFACFALRFSFETAKKAAGFIYLLGNKGEGRYFILPRLNLQLLHQGASPSQQGSTFQQEVCQASGTRLHFAVPLGKGFSFAPRAQAGALLTFLSFHRRRP